MSTPASALAAAIGTDIKSLRNDIKNLQASTLMLVLETAPGIWTGDAPARSTGAIRVMFIGSDDPADATNGVNTPANILPTDVWLKRQ